VPSLRQYIKTPLFVVENQYDTNQLYPSSTRFAFSLALILPPPHTHTHPTPLHSFVVLADGRSVWHDSIWSTHDDGAGTPYYYNQMTGESTYHHAQTVFAVGEAVAVTVGAAAGAGASGGDDTLLVGSRDGSVPVGGGAGGGAAVGGAGAANGQEPQTLRRVGSSTLDLLKKISQKSKQNMRSSAAAAASAAAASAAPPARSRARWGRVAGKVAAIQGDTHTRAGGGDLYEVSPNASAVFDALGEPGMIIRIGPSDLHDKAGHIQPGMSVECAEQRGEWIGFRLEGDRRRHSSFRWNRQSFVNPARQSFTNPVVGGAGGGARSLSGRLVRRDGSEGNTLASKSNAMHGPADDDGGSDDKQLLEGWAVKKKMTWRKWAKMQVRFWCGR
jgi:hypothetical protein